ncbi:M-phase phosphoprotein 6 [Condylostylus longicornis]|uniref:M-phase phosphoprotein 6 n=1 Tax=Condylostylus longicornis TaxID=2530218 RepID=UPI00244E2ECC|nr:M-phase phosphoprotein 6 [Condylostylus longicornis]
MSKRKLSKGILEMKFMKRSKEKVAKENEEIEGREMYAKETTAEMLKDNGTNFIMEPSYALIEDLIEARISCRGINPEIERLMELEQLEKAAKEDGAMDKEVDDEEMSKYIKINKKFKKK